MRACGWRIKVMEKIKLHSKTCLKKSHPSIKRDGANLELSDALEERDSRRPEKTDVHQTSYQHSLFTCSSKGTNPALYGNTSRSKRGGAAKGLSLNELPAAICHPTLGRAGLSSSGGRREGSDTEERSRRSEIFHESATGDLFSTVFLHGDLWSLHLNSRNKPLLLLSRGLLARRAPIAEQRV
ncbi:hypothetical protein AOLI_G00176900 [Acnodon oligacanthus]